MTLKAVEINHLSVKFNEQLILRDINFSIEEKDFVAIIGPNGGGKSTLLKVILGILPPDAGEVKVFGKEPKKARDLMGYLPQNLDFDHDFPINVFDTVLTGRYHGLFKKYSKKDNEIGEWRNASNQSFIFLAYYVSCILIGREYEMVMFIFIDKMKFIFISIRLILLVKNVPVKVFSILIDKLIVLIFGIRII